MPADLLTQLEMVGRVLDRAAPPLVLEELMAAAPSEPAGASAGDDLVLPFEVVRLTVPGEVVADAADRRHALRLLALAAAVVLLVAGLVLLAGRPGTGGGRPAAGDSVPGSTAGGRDDTTVVVPTTDPLAGVDLPPDDDTPGDLVQRFSSPLADGGRIWVYDSASTGRIYYSRQDGGVTVGYGWFDPETYASGLGWSLEGTPATAILWGLTPPTNPVTVTVGNLTVESDADGLWSVIPPADATSFTITTSSGSVTNDILVDPSVATTVFVTLPPTSLEPAPTVDPDSALAAAMQPTGTVLVVNASAADGLATSLTGELRASGYDVADPVNAADGVELATSMIYSWPAAPLATLNAIMSAVPILSAEDFHGQAVPALDDRMIASADLVIVLGDDLADAPWQDESDPLIDPTAGIGALLVLDATTTDAGHQRVAQRIQELSADGVLVADGGTTIRPVEGSRFMPVAGSTPWAFAVAQLAGIDGFDGWDPTLVADPLPDGIAAVLVIADE